MTLRAQRLPSWRQIKHLPRFLSPKEKNWLKVLFAVAVLSFFAAGSKYVTDHVQTVPSDGGEYVEATVGSPHLVNPVLASGSDADLDLVRLVFAGLVRTDASGQIVGDLAEKWEISADGKTYDFRLRPDLKWHDGEPLKASDVAFTFAAAKNPAWRSPYQPRFRNVQVETPDDQSIRFVLQEPFAPFLSYLTLGIMPEHLWGDIKPENAVQAELNIKPVGAGPFMFKSLTKDKRGAIRSYTLARNPDYCGGAAHLETVTMKFYPDFASAADALLGRRVDGISYLPDEYLEDVLRLRTVAVHRLRAPQYTAVFLNANRNPLLKDKTVRQALAYAVDREKIITGATRSGSIIVDGPILPGQPGYGEGTKRYAYDTEAAAKLLDAAGWRVGEDGIRAKSAGKDAKTVLSLTLTTVETKENSAVANLLAEAWRSIGVKVDLEILDAARFQRERIRPRSFEALLYGEITGADGDPYPFWHSSQIGEAGLNLSGWQSRRADELMEQARRTLDPTARAAAYKEFQSLLTEDEPAIFLYSPTYNYAVSRRFRGLAGGTVFEPADRFADVTSWYVETKRAWK